MGPALEALPVTAQPAQVHVVAPGVDAGERVASEGPHA
jgi:hypothetical protein